MRRYASTLWTWAKAIAVALPLVLLVRTSVVEAYRIPSSSMEGTILAGDRVIAEKITYGSRVPILGIQIGALRDPVPGEIVVFRSPVEPGARFIKRCVAVGGQTVEIRGGDLWVDGDRIEPPPHAILDWERSWLIGDAYGPVTVPPGHLFVMGDNRDNSTDSRAWGFLPRRMVLARAIVIYWSWSPDRGKSVWRRVRWSRIGDRVS